MSADLPRRGLAALLGVALFASPGELAAAPKNAKKPPTAPPSSCLAVDVRDDEAFLAFSVGFEVWSIRDPLRPSVTHFLPMSNSVFGVVAGDDVAWLAAGNRGLYVLALGDDRRPEVLARFDTPGITRDVAVRGTFAFLADDHEGLRVVDLAIPERPQQVAQIGTRDGVRGLDLAGPRLVIAEGRAGARLFDVTRPDVPRELALVRSILDVRDAAISDDLLVVVGREPAVALFRIRENAPLEPLGRLELPDDRPPEHLDIDGTIAVLTDGGPELRIVDLSDPRRPFERSRIHMGRAVAAGSIAFAGDRAYVALGPAGLGIVDLADRDRPRILLPQDRRLRIDSRAKRRDEEEGRPADEIEAEPPGP